MTDFSPALSDVLLTIISGLLLWAVGELIKLTRMTSALQAHQQDHDNRIKRLENKA